MLSNGCSINELSLVSVFFFDKLINIQLLLFVFSSKFLVCVSICFNVYFYVCLLFILLFL